MSAEINELAEATCGPWICYHCGEVCTTAEEAAEHFGDIFTEAPLCVETASVLADRDMVREMILQQRELWQDLMKTNAENETLEHQINNFEYVARKLTGKPSASPGDLTLEWDSMEGRVLAAEAAIDAAPRWLASMLRKRSERKWRRSKAASQ